MSMINLCFCCDTRNSYTVRSSIWRAIHTNVIHYKVRVRHTHKGLFKKEGRSRERGEFKRESAIQEREMVGEKNLGKDPHSQDKYPQGDKFPIKCGCECECVGGCGCGVDVDLPWWIQCIVS